MVYYHSDVANAINFSVDFQKCIKSLGLNLVFSIITNRFWVQAERFKIKIYWNSDVADVISFSEKTMCILKVYK